MTVEFKGALAKLLKFVTFGVLAVEDDSSENTQVAKITMAEPLTVRGSNPLPNGGTMNHTDNIIYVAADDIAEFEKGCTENPDGTVTYKGAMKLDVSKPKVRQVNGKVEVTQGPKLWLVSVPFNRRGASLRTTTRDAAREAIIALFTPKAEGAGTHAATGITTGGKKLEPVETK
jgi:hypothetical protein